MSQVINSHIQITQGLLRGFSFKESDGEKVYYLNLENNNIGKEKIRILGSEKYYYSEQNEEFLGKIENDFGQTVDKIKKFQKQKLMNIVIDKNDFFNIKQFFEYSFIRSEKYLEQINKESISSQLLGSFKHDDIIEISKNTNIAKLFNYFKTNIIINNSNINFVIPRNVIYIKET
jgi:hypothetical protein